MNAGSKMSRYVSAQLARATRAIASASAARRVPDGDRRHSPMTSMWTGTARRIASEAGQCSTAQTASSSSRSRPTPEARKPESDPHRQRPSGHGGVQPEDAAVVGLGVNVDLAAETLEPELRGAHRGQRGDAGGDRRPQVPPRARARSGAADGGGHIGLEDLAVRTLHADGQPGRDPRGGKRIGVARLVGMLGQVGAGALDRGADLHRSTSVPPAVLRKPSSSSTVTPNDSAFASLLPALSPASR